VNEKIFVKSAGCGGFLYRAGIRFSVAHHGITAIEQAGHSRTGQEIHMYVRTTSNFILAVALMATTASVYAVQDFDQITVLGMTLSVPHIALATDFDQVTVLGMTLSVPHIALATTDDVYAAQTFEQITVLGKAESVPIIASSEERP
jgi:hypothetical protein